MAFLKRVLSGDYRRGLAAEAAGEFLLAARAYALAGERAKVAEMHLLAADKASGQQARLGELRAAARWASAEPGAGRAGAALLMERIAGALIEAVRSAGAVGDTDRVILREAADLFARAGSGARAGQVFELCGDEQAAAEAYQDAGELEHLERLLNRDEERRQHEQRLSQAMADHQRLLSVGARRLALERLRECARLEPAGPSRGALEALEALRFSSGRLSLREGPDRAAVVYAGPEALPFGIGRDPTCELPLRDERISRRHAEIVAASGGTRLAVRDCGSRNGTRLGGVAIAGELPLAGRGEIALGDAVVIAFIATDGPAEPALQLEVIRGADRGQRAILALAPLPLAGGALALRFEAGVPIIEPARERSGVRLLLNGQPAGPVIELLRGDAIDLVGDDGARFHLEAG